MAAVTERDPGRAVLFGDRPNNVMGSWPVGHAPISEPSRNGNGDLVAIACHVSAGQGAFSLPSSRVGMPGRRPAGRRDAGPAFGNRGNVLDDLAVWDVLVRPNISVFLVDLDMGNMGNVMVLLVIVAKPHVSNVQDIPHVLHVWVIPYVWYD